MILVLILYMLLASTFTIGKIALSYCPPLLLIAVRMVVAGSLLLCYQYLFDREHWKLKKQDLWIFGQLIMFHIFWAYNLEFWALQYIDAAKACLIYNLSPFITALYSYFLFKHKLNWQKWLGLSIGFLGFIPLLLSTEQNEVASGSGMLFSFAEIALLFSVFSAALGWLYIKKLLDRDYAITMANGVAMLGGGILTMVVSLFLEGAPMLRMPAHLEPWDKMAITYFGVDRTPLILFILFTGLLIIIANFICYNLYGYLLKKYSPTFVSFAGFSSPLFAAAYDWLFFGNLVSWNFLITVFLIFWGLFIFYQQERKA